MILTTIKLKLKPHAGAIELKQISDRFYNTTNDAYMQQNTASYLSFMNWTIII